MSRLFQIRFEKPEHKIKVLNNDIGAFVDIDADMIFNNDVIEGIFTFKVLASGKKVMSFDAVSLKRFSILFAFCVKNTWRIRLSLVFTTKQGVLGFRVTKALFTEEDGRLKVPKTWEGNTVLFFGIQSENDDVDMTMRIHANKTYEAEISWDCLRDEIYLSDNLKPSNAKKCSFPKHLYNATNQNPIAALAQQRSVPSPSLPESSSFDTVVGFWFLKVVFSLIDSLILFQFM